MIDYIKKISGANRNYIYTFFSQMFALLLAVAALKLAATTFDAPSFGLYNIVRRIISLLNFPLLLGLGISIPIFVARGLKSEKLLAPYLFTAIVFWIIATCLLFCINLFAGHNLAMLLLNVDKIELVVPLILCFSSLYSYTILYAVYRGAQIFYLANIFQITASGIVPVLAILLSNHSVYNFLYIMGVAGLFINMICFLHIYKKGFVRWVSYKTWKEAAKEILFFGIPRVPGEFALFGLMSFPLFYIAKYGSIEKAGYVAIGFTLVQLVASLFEFLGTLLLPKTTILIADEAFLQLKKIVSKILIISVVGSITISAVLFFNLQWILSLLDKSKFLKGVNEMRVVIYCIPFYIVYLVLRNPIDAISHRPYNMYNLVVVFILQTCILFFGGYFINLAAIYTLSVAFPLMLLGVFTFYRWKFILKKHIEKKTSFSCG